jgi:membrane-bound lytic murein transglycosylase D
LKFRLSILIIISSCCIFLNAAYARFAPNVWDVLRAELSLNHEVTQPEVQTQLRWIISHPSYLQKLARSEPYIYHIITEIKKRRMPGEIALLPMIESAYDPFAYSGAGAAGLWQLMPGTGNNLGLKQDWWYDGRRSIRPSTDAALNYLTYLNKYFNGNWILAIAAYDSGEGTVSRAIKASGQSGNIRFWSLPVPSETRAYVPRLLALAEIIKYPQRYRVTLPDIPHTPYFEEVNIGSQIDLNHAAKLAGISYKDLIKLNPGFNRWATAPYKPFKLLIPTNKVANFNRNLSQVPQEKRVSWARHQVHFGDSLDSIARRYFTTAKLIRELNQLKSDKLKSGQYILIPSTKNAIAARSAPVIHIPDHPATSETYKVVHIVQAGETLQRLENKYHVTASKIRIWNKLNSSSKLSKGDQLIIWRNLIKPGIYTVVAGDNLSSIAKRHKTTVSSLEKLNPNLNIRLLKPGQRLIVG